MVEMDPVKSPTPDHQVKTGLVPTKELGMDGMMTSYTISKGLDSQASTECTGDRDSRSHSAMKPSHGMEEKEKVASLGHTPVIHQINLLSFNKLSYKRIQI